MRDSVEPIPHGDDEARERLFVAVLRTCHSVYIVDVEGSRVVIVAGENIGASAADIAEVDAIIASITFEP
jgi:hypothetical protein